MDLIHILLFTDFNDYIKVFGYLGIFLFFITIDQLTFIPEEITLLSIGYLSAHGVFDPFLAGAISLFSFLLVDSVYFFLARSGKKWAQKLRSKVERSAVGGLKQKLKDHFPKTLLVLCFIPRMRMFAPIIAGMIQTSIKKFMIYDAIGLFLFTSVYISIGYFFHQGLSKLLVELETLQHFIFFGVMLLLFILIVIFLKKKDKTKYLVKENGQ